MGGSVMESPEIVAAILTIGAMPKITAPIGGANAAAIQVVSCYEAVLALLTKSDQRLNEEKLKRVTERK
jgi:hypothetical protein